MSRTNPPDRLVIERHPIQHMLRLALTSRPQGCRGIFGGAEPGCITHAAGTDETEAMAILEHSQPDSLGIFYSSLRDRRPAPEIIRHIAAELHLANPCCCILLALDTEGRMEALAYRLDDFTPLPLEMAEDHALSQARENR